MSVALPPGMSATLRGLGALALLLGVSHWITWDVAVTGGHMASTVPITLWQRVCGDPVAAAQFAVIASFAGAGLALALAPRIALVPATVVTLAGAAAEGAQTIAWCLARPDLVAGRDPNAIIVLSQCVVQIVIALLLVGGCFEVRLPPLPARK